MLTIQKDGSAQKNNQKQWNSEIGDSCMQMTGIHE